MAKSKTTSSFRFDNDFIEMLNAWSLASKRDKDALLQEAFREYAKMEQNSGIAKKVNRVTEILKLKEQEG